MSERDRIEAGLREASTAVEAARTLLIQGQAVDLAGIETHIDTVCGGIAALAGAERPGLKPAMLGLIDTLDRLAELISAQNQAISDQLRGLSKRHQAVSAYSDLPGKPETGSKK